MSFDSTVPPNTNSTAHSAYGVAPVSQSVGRYLEKGKHMLTKMRTSLRDYRSTLTLLPTLSAAEQTRASWAKSIGSYDAVPKHFQPFFEPLLATGQVFPYSVLAPSYEGFIHRTAEKLVCVFDHEICVLLRSGNTFETQCYPLAGIGHVEVRTILLDSHIKISGATRQGAPGSTTIRFNTVSDYLFRPVLEKIRLAAVDTQKATQSSESDRFDRWARLSYKFMNFAKRSILGGESVIHAMLQTEIRASLWTVLGKTYYQTISPTHVSILTDRELILIREEVRQGRDDRYGGIWDYIPLKKIGQILLRERGNDLLALSIQLPEGDTLERVYEASAGQEVSRFLEQYRMQNDKEVIVG